MCKSKLIECVNIGFINSKWHYKIILKEKLDGVIRGDNLTIGDKLHILSEFYENASYKSLDMIVEGFTENNIKDNELNNSLDSVGLISYKNPGDLSKNPKSRRVNNKNSNSEEHNKNDIAKEIEIVKDNKCQSCADNLDLTKCSIF